MQLLSSFSPVSTGHRTRRGKGGSAWWFHLLGAIALVAGLFLPLTDLGQAMAAPGSSSPVVQRLQSSDDTVPPAPVQVAAIGDFQQALGCADFDPYCQITQLFNNNGIWTGVFAVPPGSYSWQIAAVAQDGAVSTYGDGGLGGDPQQVEVGEGDVGLYFELDTHTNEVAAEAVSSLLSVQVDGASSALRPDDGGYTALITHPGGTANLQVFSGGEPLVGPQQADLSSGPNRLTFSADGQLVNVEALTPGSLTVQRLDADGAPLSGGCYQLRDGGGVVNQGCDADDGALDGNTFMTFPQGVPGGSVTVVEVTVPDGAEPVGDQELSLEAGDMVVTLQPQASGGEEDGGEEDGEGQETQEEDGQVIEAGDVTISEDEVQAGDVTISQGEDGQTIIDTGDEEDGGDQQATDTADQQPGDLTVTLEGEDGDPIGGACFALLQDGQSIIEVCDTIEFDPADFADNGTTGFFGVPSGTYTLQLTQAPDGVTADDREVEVVAGTQVTETVTASSDAEEGITTDLPEPADDATATVVATQTGEQDGTEPGPPANFTVTLLDEIGIPVGGACFALLQDGEQVQEACDTLEQESEEFANNGNAGFFDVPAGTYTLTMTSAPDGIAVDDREVEIAPGSDDTVTITVDVAATTDDATATETATDTATPTEEADGGPGNLIVSLEDADGQPVGGACFELVRDGAVVIESCDTAQYEQNPGNGTIGFYGVPSGTYTLRNSENPGGLPLADERDVEITVAPPDTTVEIQLQADDEPTQTPTVAPTETIVTPTPVPTEEATEEPTTTITDALADLSDADESEPGPPGDLIVTLQDEGGQTIGGACFEIAMDGQPPIEFCDADDPFPGNGNTGFFGVPSGTYTLTQTQVPDGTNATESQQVTVEPGEGQTEIVNPGATGGQDEGEATEGEEDGQVIQGEDGQIIQQGEDEGDDAGGIRVDISDFDDQDICIQLNTAGGIGLINPPAACNNDDTDESGDDDEIELRDVAPGTYFLTVTSGAEGVEQQEVTIVAGERLDIELNQPDAPTPVPTEAPTTGTLRITVTDPEGNLLGGACFDISNDTGTFTFCDEDGDGIIDIPDVAFDTQTVVQTEAQVGYAPAGEQQIEVSLEDQNVELPVVNEPALGTVEITSENPDGDELPGACVSINQGEQQCDEDADGVITVEVAATGVEQTISQTVAPEGYQPAPDQTVLVESDETVEVTLISQPGTGTIRVISADAGLTPLAGACVALDGGEPLCDVDGDGVLNFEDVPAGEHTVSQTTPPEGYQPAGDQTVTVDAGEQTEVLFTNAPSTGSILVTVQDDAGELVTGGVCVAYQAENAEPVTTCEATETGQFRFAGVAPGTYAVFASQVPEEYVFPDESTSVEVIAGQEATATVTLPGISTVQGSASLNFQSEDGAAVAGLCFQLVPEGEGEALGPFCDNDENDQDATESLVLLQGLPQGTYSIQFLDEGNSAAQSVESAGTITIEAGVTIEQVITVPGLFLMGSVQITTVDSETEELVGGACYTISTAEPITVCDNNDDGTDLTPDEGIILVDNIDAGDYTVSLTTPPDGYSGAPDQTVTVEGGQTAQLTFDVEAEATTGTLVVNKVDDAGEPLGGTCFRLENTNGVAAEACDTVEGVDDGTVAFVDAPAGTYQLVETRTPGNEYQPAPARSVEIVAGDTVTIDVVNSLAPGRLYVIKVDAADQSIRLEDACFSLQGASNYGPYCDGDDLSVDGRTVFTNVTPGTYTLVETQAPAGYDPASNREVTINPAVTLQVTVQNSETPPPPEAGTLVVNKLDANNDPLAGGCFRLYDGDTPVTAQVCDITDGTNDARIVFENVPVGTWTLRETLAPSASYQIAPDQQVTIEDDETTEINVVNRLKNGRVLVHKVTEQGDPIQGACFDLASDGQGEQCSNASGELVFENVPVGEYTLTETVVPYGFREAAPVEDIDVNPGQTTVVTVENERQPPPNTGSVQVLKFVCPVETEDDQETVFLGGAAGDAQLAQTVGCSPANAEFTLVGQDGSDGPGEFVTGDDGHYQVTVPAEVYRLDETNPDLPGNSAALLRVEVGRLTTVVVINYVAPPAPEPVNISVAKYTCQAGFNGTTFEDFAASCMNDSQLTNGITVRAESEEIELRAVTGDGGQVGRTAFVDQPSGTYSIYEERPYNIPTNYAFCGWDGNWPADYKSVNGAITAELGEGANLSCVFFNIPEQVTDGTGVILVRKFTCDVEAPTKGYDFEEECRLSDENAQFELKQFNEELQDFDEEGTIVTANPDGFVRYPNLRPGEYQLLEVGSNWCHANSDSVNADGNVVVNAGAVSQVWIYNCVATEVPPNTGSGDAAELLDPKNQAPEGAAPGENRVTPGIAWPVILAAVVAALWPRRVLAPAVIRNQVHRDAA